MIGGLKNLGCCSDLNDFTEIHDRHAISEITDNRKIMADEQHRGVVSVLDINQQFNHRCLNRHIKRGNRFIRHHQCRRSGKGTGDADPLFLAT